MRGAAAAPTVGEVLNAAQEGAAACERCAGSLWKLALADPDGVCAQLQQCVDFLVTQGQKSAYVERCVRCFGRFAAKAPADSEAAAAVVEELLQRLAGHSAALDKVVRYRSCQLLQQLLGGLQPGLLLEDSVAQLLRRALAERLCDKLPAVRAEAVRAVSHLAAAEHEEGKDGEGQPIVEAMLGLLETDKSKDVRVAVVASLPLDDATLPPLLLRSRDVSPVMRKALLLRLQGVSVRMLSIKQRAELLLQVLQDRDAAVADAAAKLLAHWLGAECGGDPLQLLQLLDVETYTEAAVRAVESLIASGSLRPPGSQPAAHGGEQGGATAYVEAVLGGSAGALPSLRAAADEGRRLLDAHEALMWRCLCEWLHSDAISKGLAAAATGGARAAVQAAAAAERHEVLERVLPDSAGDMLRLVMRHAAAGPSARFAAAQLLTVAASCVEWTDAASRDMALPYLQRLMGLDPLSEVEQDGDLDLEAEGGGAAGGLALAGNGGQGLFEAAVVALVAAVQGAGGGGEGFASAVLEGLEGLAAAAGLLPVPGAEAPESTVRFGEPARVLQCLSYVYLMLQRLPSGGCASQHDSGGGELGFAALWDLLLLLALKQDQPAIRARAVECIGLYATAAAATPGLLPSAVRLLGPLLVAGGDCATRGAAAKGLADAGLLFGPAAVDAALRAPGAAAAAEGAGGGADAEAGCALPGLGSQGLLELLLDVAEQLLAEAQALMVPSKGAKRTGRAGARATEEGEGGLAPASAELLATVAEALAKLLLLQRAWLSRYEPGQALGAGGALLPLPPDSRQQQALLLRRALALLLQLQFHPATETAPALRQCLSAFFDVFAAAAPEHRLQLAAAVLPAARQALHVPCKKNPAALLSKYALQLLQATRAEQDQELAHCAAAPTAGPCTLLGETYEGVAQQLLGEVEVVAAVTVSRGVQPAKYKPYLSALLKVVCELPLRLVQPPLGVLQLLADRLSESVGDAMLSKDLAAVQQLLQSVAGGAPAGAEQERLGAEQLEQLVEQMRVVSLEQLVPLPDGTQAAAAAARPTRSKNRAPAAVPAAAVRTTRARKAAPAAAARSSSSSGDDDDDSSSGGDTTEASDAESDAATGGEGLAAGGCAAPSKAMAAAAAALQQHATSRQPLGLSSIVNSQH